MRSIRFSPCFDRSNKGIIMNSKSDITTEEAEKLLEEFSILIDFHVAMCMLIATISEPQQDFRVSTSTNQSLML